MTQISLSEAPRLDCGYAFDVVSGVTGTGLLEEFRDSWQGAFDHSLATGQLAGEILAESGCDAEIVRQATLMGGAHDLGKARPDLAVMGKSGRAFTVAERVYYSTEHANEGGYRIGSLALRVGTQDQRKDLAIAAFGARHHHDMMRPDEYGQFSKERALLWGLVHVVQVADILHARHYDNSRGYKPLRDGRVVTPQDIYNDLARDHPRYLNVGGAWVDVLGSVASRLGVEPTASSTVGLIPQQRQS